MAISSNMAISTVSSYEKLDYNKQCVRALYSFQMPKNCCVPHCTKKGYVEGGKRFLTSSFHRKSICSTSGFVRFVGRHFKVTDNTCVCSRHFKDGDFEVSLTGRRTQCHQDLNGKQLLPRRESPQQNQDLTFDL